MKLKILIQRIFITSFLGITILFLPGCNDGKIHLESYYFPVGELKDAKIYIYESLRDSIPPSLWYYKSYSKDNSSFLESQSFDVRLQVNQFAVEKKVKSGMLIQSNTLYLADSAGHRKAVNVEILQKNMFPFSVTDTNGIFLYSVKWSAKPNTHNTVTRNRRFLGFEDHNYKGKPVKCAKFELKELIEDYNDGYLEYSINGFEYYGLNLGLIYYEKIVNDKIRLAYELNDILSLDAFNKKYNTRFQPLVQ